MQCLNNICVAPLQSSDSSSSTTTEREREKHPKAMHFIMADIDITENFFLFPYLPTTTAQFLQATSSIKHPSTYIDHRRQSKSNVYSVNPPRHSHQPSIRTSKLHRTTSNSTMDHHDDRLLVHSSNICENRKITNEHSSMTGEDLTHQNQLKRERTQRVLRLAGIVTFELFEASRRLLHVLDSA